MSETERKKKRKEKFKEGFNILTKKNYAELTEKQKETFDYAKQNNLIAARNKNKSKGLIIYDPKDYRQVRSITGLGKDTVKRKFERKQDKEVRKNIHNLPKRRTFSTNYGRDVGLKPNMEEQYMNTLKKYYEKGGKVRIF